MSKKTSIAAVIKSYYKETQREEDERLSRVGILTDRIRELNVSTALCEIKTFRQKEKAFLKMKRESVGAKDFTLVKQIGEGGSGTVYLAQKTNSGHYYALKVIQKKRNKDLDYVRLEKEILVMAKSMWLVKLFYSFQDEESLYLVMEYLAGGDLMGVLIRNRTLTYSPAVFYVAEIVLALEEIHGMGIAHRDLKPDNIMLTKEGHIRLTDFGLSAQLKGELVQTEKNKKKTRRKMARTRVGTPDYIAPEVLSGKEYGMECDWWSLGIIVYEIFTGNPPFKSRTSLETYKKIQNWPATFKVPPAVPRKAESLICGLIQWPEKRLGRPEDVKKHPFFDGINWKTLAHQKAPFVPDTQSLGDTKYFDAQKNVKKNIFARTPPPNGSPNTVVGYNFQSFDSLSLDEFLSDEE
ncbi:MAG: AGC/NDR protein kinase [Amphiamblys sp. WSBS2006]|nr:MAG: AGC/NDR protein kinase [Amphiamblys sp. WSBS2006]